MKTKRFLLATSGATVDGRNIDAEMLTQMASSYDPATYMARLNIEHIRGISGDGPFRAYGDVVSLETEDVTVNFNGEPETRTGLYGVFDISDDAKMLNESGQKLYSSIEINPNFAGKNFAYLMGCALTDSPASIATERLEFNRSMPGMVTLSSDSKGQSGQSYLLELAADSSGDNADQDADASGSFISNFGKMLENVFSKHQPKSDAAGGNAQSDAGQPDGSQAQLTADDLRPLFTQMATDVSAALTAQQSAFNAEVDTLTARLKKLETEFSATPEPSHIPRPKAAGPNGKFSKTDC